MRLLAPLLALAPLASAAASAWAFTDASAAVSAHKGDVDSKQPCV